MALILGLCNSIPDEEFLCESEDEIFITSNGRHIDLILPIALADSLVINSSDKFNGAQYIAFGWGDEIFYRNTPTWNDFEMGTGLRAIFLDQPCAIHLYALYQKKEDWKRIGLCRAQVMLLNEYFDSQFQKSEGRLIEIEGITYGENDIFFKAKGNFSPVLTCNEWAKRALTSAKIESPCWSPFDKAILHSFRDHH